MFEPPQHIASIMRDFKPLWFVAGGWAIDLYLKKETRQHDDIEIAVFRPDQSALQHYLQDWQLQKVVNGVLVRWNKNELLEPPVHEIHCFRVDCEAISRFEVLLNEINRDKWIFRRNRRVVKPISQLYGVTDSGIRFLRPEIVLLYKSKNPRAKDEQDFLAAAGKLEPESNLWLQSALQTCYSRQNQHPWVQKLKNAWLRKT